ncbi:hypothetical protein [Comamonas sp.]|uniref:hypothetical protein n=1 Tax=Comamonas sp. TaxID=34028 RepID=UPI00289C82C5|nr:hypothetical protein [Comamonas sp.]
MRLSSIVLPLALLALLASAGCKQIPYSPLPAPPTGIRYEPGANSAGIARMSETELLRQKRLAQGGDKRAAFNVYQHLRSVENDDAQARDWLILAADLGHAPAQYNLAQIGIYEQDSASALYWAKRARASGYAHAAELVQSLENPE